MGNEPVCHSWAWIISGCVPVTCKKMMIVCLKQGEQGSKMEKLKTPTQRANLEGTVWLSINCELDNLYLGNIQFLHLFVFQQP